MIVPLAILELTCVLIYAVPTTSVPGAILLTGRKARDQGEASVETSLGASL